VDETIAVSAAHRLSGPTLQLYAGVAAGAAVAAALTAAAFTGGPRMTLAVSGALLGAASTVPYLTATIRGRVKPRLVTWGTWCLITGMAAIGSATAGDLAATAFAGVGCVATACVVVVGWRHGERGLGRLDVACLALIVVGVIVWQLLDQPAAAVLAACVIDVVALVPTLVHVLRAPHEEDATTYALQAAGGLAAGLAAFGDWTVTAVAYPLYVTVAMGLVAALALRRAPAPNTRSGRTTTPTTRRRPAHRASRRRPALATRHPVPGHPRPSRGRHRRDSRDPYWTPEIARAT
jgi:hypothetical protein